MQCDFRTSIERLAHHGVRQTAVWLDKLNEIGTGDGARILEGSGYWCSVLGGDHWWASER